MHRLAIIFMLALHAQWVGNVQPEMTATEPTRPHLRRPGVRVILHAMRVLGAFKLAQFLTRKRLRILGYHGIAVEDQHVFSPFLFMQESTFAKRLAILRKRRMRVVSLDDAVKNLQGTTKGLVQAVITIDDGWWSTLEFAAPLLKRFGYPATLYLATRHAVEGGPVAPVVLGYMFWKRKETQLVLTGVDPAIDGTYEITDRVDAAQALLERKISQLDGDGQALMLARVAQNLGLDVASLTADKRFRMIGMSDIRTLEQMGVDTQLHTHDHAMPEDLAGFREQLEQNRDWINRYRHGDPPRHFCYPSGRYRPEHAQWLAQLGILSAATCDSGMNSRGDNPYLLRRFLDSDNISDIEFEAHISGVFEMARLLRYSVRRYLGR
jgi:peptidoglycan/xylan/chitin deacetylase (PgdA/CDA1 family)